MAKRIAGAAGIGIWTGLVVVAVVAGFQTATNAKEKMFENLPEGWKVEKSFVAPNDERLAISRRLGARISKLSNTFLSINGRSLQVNILHCRTVRGAEEVYEAILKAHSGLAVSVARDGSMVIEFAKCDDPELMKKARRVLGLAEGEQAGAAEKGATEALFKNLPPGWKVKKTFIVPEDQSAAISKKLGGKITKLSNTILSANGNKVQVNILDCPTSRDAESVQQGILAMKPNPAFCLLHEKRVVEFVCENVNLAIKAAWELGLKPKPTEVQYKITFDAAPLEKGDFMSWNRLVNLFAALNEHPDSNDSTSEMTELLKRFEFANEIVLRTCGNAGAKPVYRFKPQPNKTEAMAQGDITKYTFENMPQKAGVHYVSIEATVTTHEGGLMPGTPKQGDDLLGPTQFWPVDDPHIEALAQKITAGHETQEDRVRAVLEWLMPGKNISFKGPVTGSRYGVRKVLEQGFGHCWDFCDCFVTLCRASGVPCRQVAGWFYGAGGHTWAEVLIEGKAWQQVDPTGGTLLQCGIYHIPWLTSEDGAMPVLYVSLPKIELLK